MKAKLKVIKNWEFEEFELTGTSFKYSPTGCKGMVARSEDEIVFWTYHLVQKCSGVLWVKGEVSRWIPSPEPKEQQDVWEDPVLLSCDRGILLVCPASKSLWWMPQMDGEWIPIPMDNWCAQGIPKPVAVTGSQGVFPIVCRVDNSADATNSFTSLTVDFETMTAHWAESGSCVYSKAGTRQTHLAAVERAGGNFAQADFHYNYPMIGSILEQNGQFYAFLESSTINPAGLSLMGYYTYEALELWGLDTLVKGQEGYAYNPVEQKVIKDWDEHLVVIASDAGDPYCLDLRRNDTSVFWAEHGAGTWDFQPAFDCLEDFLESVLDVPKTQEYETAYPYHYIRLIVTGISDTKKALVFLKQHFGDSSFQQTKDRLKELPLLIYSGLDTGTAPLENSLDRWGLMYEKQQISLEKFLEDQAYIRNL